MKGGSIMKLLERLALIKAGYTKKEIAEIEAAELLPEQPEPDKPEPEPEKGKAPEEPEPEEPEAVPDDDNIDYKKLYEDVKAQLADAQKVNVALAIGAGTDTDDDQTAWRKVIESAL